MVVNIARFVHLFFFGGGDFATPMHLYGISDEPISKKQITNNSFGSLLLINLHFLDVSLLWVMIYYKS